MISVPLNTPVVLPSDATLLFNKNPLRLCKSYIASPFAKREFKVIGLDKDSNWIVGGLVIKPMKWSDCVLAAVRIFTWLMSGFVFPLIALAGAYYFHCKNRFIEEKPYSINIVITSTPTEPIGIDIFCGVGGEPSLPNIPEHPIPHEEEEKKVADEPLPPTSMDGSFVFADLSDGEALDAYLESEINKPEGIIPAEVAPFANAMIKRGHRYLKYLKTHTIEEAKIKFFEEIEKEYDLYEFKIREIGAAIAWYCMFLALRQKQGFHEGAFTFEDPENKLVNFLNELKLAQDRLSTHLPGLAPKIQKGLNVLPSSGIALPAQKHHLLWTAFKLSDGKARAYLKPENYGMVEQWTLADFNELFMHTVDLVIAQGRKIGWGSDEEPGYRKERVRPEDLLEFNQLLDRNNQSLPGIDIAQVKARAKVEGISGMYYFSQQVIADENLVAVREEFTQYMAQLLRKFPDASVRIGNEVIIDLWGSLDSVILN